MIETRAWSPVVSMRTAAWETIRIKHYRLRSGSFPEHEYKEHAAFVTLGGACRTEIRAAGGFHSRNQGGVLVIPSHCPHSVSLEGEAEYASLLLSPAALARAASEAGLGASFEIRARCSERDPVVSQVAKALLAEMDSGGICGRLYVESLANLFAVHLLRHYSVSEPVPARSGGGLSGQRLRRVIDYMSENYEQDLSLADLAAEAEVSPFHFAREFKKSTGYAPHQYLRKLRVERAKRMLVESDLPLVEVGLRAGFSHQSHFTKVFRQLTGMTPNSYRDSSGRRAEPAA